MDLWHILQKADKPIVLYGMGDGADKILSACDAFGITISGVFSSQEFARNKSFRGFKVMTYQHMAAIYPDMIILVAFGTSDERALQEIFHIGHEQEILVPDVPVVGEGLFTEQFFLHHKDEFEKVFHQLADVQSQKVFESIIQYKLSGNPMLLFDCETELFADQQKILNLGSEETYLDLGAYKGDTIEEFLKLTEGTFQNIIAVEPDEKNFQKLQQATKGKQNITCIHAGVGEASGTMHFDAKGGRNSRRSDKGTEIPMVCIDEVGQEATYIKMDVEGQELAAIDGGRRVIAHHHPKMQIAAYHRNEDLFTLPLEVLKLYPYKVYLRHSRAINAWDTNFFFVD